MTTDKIYHSKWYMTEQDNGEMNESLAKSSTTTTINWNVVTSLPPSVKAPTEVITLVPEETVFHKIARGMDQCRKHRQERRFREWYSVAIRSVEETIGIARTIIPTLTPEEENVLVNILYASTPENRKGIKTLERYYCPRERLVDPIPVERLRDFCRSKGYPFLVTDVDFSILHDKLYGLVEDEKTIVIEFEQDQNDECDDLIDTSIVCFNSTIT